MECLKQQASGGALQSRTPLVKSQTLGGPPIRPPDGVSCGSSAVFPPTCSLGTLLTFQWQGCLLCIVLTSDAGHYQTDMHHRDILDQGHQLVDP